ncbi:O-Glycosyl hydrolases family 17 protein [Klebsormidium nitens]|uniref:O-Glycosyl hydrolases family 17 protein n=1 Tax=Klebsormidium nitens TaxID=105231 RepID=A0A1Y1HYD9_KLENI|nr:O-Glycosyl hydrolases family 17 protein [Klebsormidium nitens]|eukprot:GAQ82179.1 O-Glycosyl hydrolases family 17 protein [Klebsormidium nitens]
MYIAAGLVLRTEADRDVVSRLRAEPQSELVGTSSGFSVAITRYSQAAFGGLLYPVLLTFFAGHKRWGTHQREIYPPLGDGMKGVALLIALGALVALTQHCAVATTSWTPPGMGVNYGGSLLSTKTMTPNAAVKLMTEKQIGMVKMFDADSTILKALFGSEIEVAVAVPNDTADDWVTNNVKRYLFPGGVKIRWICVGNEVFGTWQMDAYKPWLYPAMLKVLIALQAQKIDNVVKITTPVNTGDLGGSDPPSSGFFKPELVTLYRQILSLLKATGSRFMVNVYPFLVAEQNDSPALAQQAQFRDNLGTYDPVSGVFYTNLFDKTVDATYAALNKTGYPDVDLLIGECGWPTAGSTYASIATARQFNSDFTKRCLSGQGTPGHSNRTLGCFLFELLDEDLKETGPGPFETSWGVFNATGYPMYDIDFTNTTFFQADGLPKRWCVAGNIQNEALLQSVVSSVCGFNSTECLDIAPGGACFSPPSNMTTTQLHASYALNRQYQLNKQNPQSCNGVVVTTDPSFSYCKFEIGTKVTPIMGPPNAISPAIVSRPLTGLTVFVLIGMLLFTF